MLFNKKRFSLSLLEGVLTSCAIYFITYGTLVDGTNHNGQDLADGQVFAFLYASILIVTVTLRVRRMIQTR